MDALKNRIVSNVMFVAERATIRDVIILLRDKRVSSVMVTGANDQVTGIVTERDVVWKLTDLDVADKLDHTVNTIMSRPVQFARLRHLREDVRRLHLEHRFRHFPILDDSGSGPTREHVVGIMTVTDLFRMALVSSAHVDKTMPPKADHPVVTIRLLSVEPKSKTQLSSVFGALNCKIEDVDFEALKLQTNLADKLHPLVLDMDGIAVERLVPLLQRAKGEKAFLILLSSDQRLVAGMRGHLDPVCQHIALKPPDISYLHWLITQNAWGGGS